MLGSAGFWIFFSFFCTEWISASTQSRVQFYNQEEEFVESDIKLQLGFFSANITLKATDEIEFPNRNWNERFQMHQIDSDYNVLLKNGVPSPILEIASHFTSRSSRQSLQRSKKFVLFFRISFAFQALSLLLWLIAVCIISKTITVGAQFLLLSGLGQIMACTLIAFVPEMIIHLPGSKLETGFGWCWSLNLGMGLYSFLLGIIIQMMDCFAQSHIQEFFNFVPWEENDCFDCQQLGFKCDHCTKETNRKANENTRYESETVRAVRKMVNGGKMYPKAISMKLEDELNFEKKQNSKTKRNSQKSSKSSKSSTLCKFYNTPGGCEKGDSCPYRHGSRGEGKGKGKRGPSGPELPRERVTSEVVTGEVLEWKGKYGWIQPTVPLEHPMAQRKNGALYCSMSDLVGGATELTKGALCQFHVFSDASGLGAEEVMGS